MKFETVVLIGSLVCLFLQSRQRQPRLAAAKFGPAQEATLGSSARLVGPSMEESGCAGDATRAADAERGRAVRLTGSQPQVGSTR